MSITREFHSETGQIYIIADECTFLAQWGIFKVINGDTVRIGEICEAQEEADGYDISILHTKDGEARHIGQTNHVPIAMKWLLQAYEKEWSQ